MSKTVVHVSELPKRLRDGREDGFVELTIADVPQPSDAQKLAFLREQLAIGERDAIEGRVSPAEDVFARLRRALPDQS